MSRVALDDLRVLRFLDVVEHVAELNGPETHQRGAMRIAFLIGERVVLAVHGNPFLRRQPGRQPQREPEEPRGHGMKDQRPVTGRAVQENRGAEHGDLGEDGGDGKTQDERKQHAETPSVDWAEHPILSRLSPFSARNPA
jgi:hypothetical protein